MWHTHIHKVHPRAHGAADARIVVSKPVCVKCSTAPYCEPMKLYNRSCQVLACMRTTSPSNALHSNTTNAGGNGPRGELQTTPHRYVK